MEQEYVTTAGGLDDSSTPESGYLVSVQATIWAWEQGITGSDLLTLLALANFADERHSCYPSQGYLSRITGLSVRTLRRSIGSLQDAGLLRWETRARENGSQTSHRYFLAVGGPVSTDLDQADDAPVRVTGGADKLTGGGGQNDRPRGDKLTAPDPLEEPLDGLLPIPPSPQQQPDTFADWYARYPRKVGRAAAEKAYRRALKTTTPEALADGLTRYLAEIDRKNTSPEYVKHPATWLNGACWDDEYAEPEEDIEFPPWSPPPPDDPSIMDTPAAYSAFVAREREKFKAEYIASRRQRPAHGPAGVPAVSGRGSR